MVLLAVRMVADVTKTRIVIPSSEFKTCMTIKSQVFTVLSRFEFETVLIIITVFHRNKYRK